VRLKNLIIAALLSPCAYAHADTVTVAVASNFHSTAEKLAADFSASSGHELRLVPGSTGKLFAQLSHGAPFDVLLAADTDTPMRLEQAGRTVADSRFTYAIGELVLWSAAAGVSDCRYELGQPGDFKVAIANPATAPYGRAAQQFLQQAGLWQKLAPQLVYGENVAQALHFAVSGNARLALIAKSQLAEPRLPASSCSWTVPRDSYEPLQQQAVLLQHAAASPAARDFLGYLRSARARDFISDAGYGVP